MNVLTGAPNKLRVAGETPAIQRNFDVTPSDNYELTYTQTENNSVTLLVEQSSNGTSGWSTLLNTTSMNGTQTTNFTPTQAYVRVKYSGSVAFSLANMTLVGTDTDTSYSVIARGDYRYAFNGMEKDDELKGSGNSYDFGARMYDSRLGRWLTIDPLYMKYPAHSPYHFALNSPMMFNDPNGEDAVITIEPSGDKTIITYSTKIFLVGKGINQDYMNQLNAYAKSAFQERETVIDGKTYILKFNVEFIDAEANKDNTSKVPFAVSNYINQNYKNEVSIPAQKEIEGEFKNTPYAIEEGDNVMIVGAKSINPEKSFSGPHESQAWIGNYSARKTQLSGRIMSSEEIMAYASVHEALHLLGLSDRVMKDENGNSVPHLGFETDWMGPFFPDKADLMVTFSPDHVRNLVLAALKMGTGNIVDKGSKNERTTIGDSQGSNYNLDSDQIQTPVETHTGGN